MSKIRKSVLFILLLVAIIFPIVTYISVYDVDDLNIERKLEEYMDTIQVSVMQTEFLEAFDDQ